MSGNYPVELFGFHVKSPVNLTLHPWKDLLAETSTSPFKHVICPHRKAALGLFDKTGYSGHCSKIRKASPNQLIGNCIVRKAKKGAASEDWIVCPERFIEDFKIFKDCRKFLIPGNFSVVKEIKIGSDGNLDYAVVSRDDDGNLLDFVGIEVQACGTGGSGPIWTARNDFLAGAFKENYKFSLNQKDASKKILVQLLHKARQIGRWRKSTVLVIQDHFLNHLRKSYAIDSHFHKQDIEEPVHIHSYRTVEKGGKITIELCESISTDMVGLSMVLISNPATAKAKKTTFEKSLENRLLSGGFVDL